MRVLLVNTFHYLRGGDCTYTYSLAELLRAHGHDVFFFGMTHPKNLPCSEERYFVDHIDFVEANRDKSLTSALRVVSRSIYSRQARKKIARLLAELKPDVAHLQNIHAHLTPSILFELEQRRIPTAWTLHDFKLICPDSRLLSHGGVCEACNGGRFFSCTIRRCKKGSLAASLVATAEAYVHNWQGIRKKVGVHIAPSRFLVRKFREFGWDDHHLVHVRNFLPTQKLGARPGGDGGYALYLGQLEPWKGVETLIRAWKSLPEAELRILGDGAQRLELEQSVRESGVSRVTFHGHLSGSDLEEQLANCAFVCMPSESYENCPYSVMEAMAAGKPVVASRIGGIPELVQEGVTGKLFEPGNASELTEKAGALAADPALRTRMGERARAVAVTEFASEAHYRHIIAIYESLVRREHPGPARAPCG